MQLQDYIFYYHSNYLKNYKEIMRAQRARNALVTTFKGHLITISLNLSQAKQQFREKKSETRF